MAPNDPKMTQKLQKSAWNGLNVFKVTSETISIRILLLLRSFWVVTWLVCDNFEFGATNWPGMVPKWPQNDPKWPQVFKVTSETISIKILPLLRSFWVVTWLVCDKFEFGDKNGPKLLRNGQKWPKIVRNGQKWLLSLKKTRIDLVYVTSGPFWSLKGGWVTFFQSRGQNGSKIQFMNGQKQLFTTFYTTQKPLLGAFSGNLGFEKKNTVAYTHFSPKRNILASYGVVFSQKHGK